MPFEKDGLCWYEKSVEYQYLVEGLKEHKFQLAWPLAGTEEAVGDSLFRDGFTYHIVEFKGQHSSFASEYKKYSADGKDSATGKQQFALAKAQLAISAAPLHYLVCGDVAVDGSAAHFVLRAYRYFECDAEAAPAVVSIQGGTHDVMKAYLKAFAAFKRTTVETFEEGGSGDGTGSGGRSPLAGKAKSLIVGIGEDSAMVFDLDYALRLVLKKQPKSTLK
jgi:hypothetical protein